MLTAMPGIGRPSAPTTETAMVPEVGSVMRPAGEMRVSLCTGAVVGSSPSQVTSTWTRRKKRLVLLPQLTSAPAAETQEMVRLMV